MSARSSRPQVFIHHETANGRNSTGSNYSVKDLIWVVEEDHEMPQEETASGLVRIPSRPTSHSNLQVTDPTQTDLPNRDRSSQEARAPSPLDKRSVDDEMKSKSTEISVDDDALDPDQAEVKPQLAVAIRIQDLGRPKLVDITNLAPMHKRKRSIAKSTPFPALKKVATQASLRASDTRSSLSVREVVEPQVTSYQQARLKRKENFITTAPLSWFPEVAPPTVGEGKLLLKELHVVSTPPPRDYDTLSLASSRPSNFPKHGGRRLSETTSILSLKSPVTPKSPTTPKSPSTPSWKGLTRSISLIRRQSMHLQQEQQQQQQQTQQPQPTKTVPKKPKMISRPANERADAPIIPPFPFEPHLVMV